MAKRFLVALLLIFCTGCSCMEIDRNPPFSSHHFRSGDLEITWQAKREAEAVSVTGTVRDIRSYYLQDLELTVRLLNGKGKVIARGTYADFPDYLAPGKDAPFHLKLSIPSGEEAEHVHFSYLFWLAQGAPPALRVYEKVPISGNFASPM